MLQPPLVRGLTGRSTMGANTLPNPAVDKTLATIGAVLWSVQIIPQIIKSYRQKNTDGLSPYLML